MSRIGELIAASSLGTPEAVALRASVPDERVARVLARVRDLDAQDRPPDAHPDPLAPCQDARTADPRGFGFPPTPTPHRTDEPMTTTTGRPAVFSGSRAFEDLPFQHHCGARWSGLSTAHCGACHVTLSSVGAFDAHRRGGHCRPPESVGLARVSGRAYEVWGFAGAGNAGDDQ